MVRNIKDVLRELGWTDGFNIPVASDENKALEREVEEQLKKKASAIVALEAVNDRLATLKKHLKNLRNEKDINQNLTCALKKQVENEKTMLRQAEFQYNKSIREVVEMKKESHKIDDRTEHMKKEIKQYLAKVKDLKDSLEWGEEALFAWEEELAHADRDYSLLQHFKAKDQEKFKELELQRQVAKGECDEMNKFLHKECDRFEGLSKQIDQTCKLYREVNAERNKLLDLWQNTVETIADRDSLICETKNKICKVKAKGREKYQKMCELMKFYDSHVQMNVKLLDNNERLKEAISELNSKSSILAEELKAFQSEHTLAQKSLAHLGSEIQLQRSQNTELAFAIRAAIRKNEVISSGNTDLQIQYETYNIDNLTVEQRCKNAEKVYKMGQDVQREGVKELERMQLTLFKLNSELKSIEEETASVKQAITMEKKKSEALSKDINDINNSAASTEEKHYELELKLELVNQEILDITENVAAQEENDKIEEKIGLLNEEIDMKQKKFIEIRNSFNEIKKELSDKMFQLKQGDAELAMLTRKLEELKLNVSSGRKAVAIAHEQYNNSLLKLNLLKIQAKNALDSMAKKGDDVSLLERQKVHLETAMKERSLEINVERDVLLAKRRVLIEEKANLKKSIEHINMRTKQFQSKYDITMDSLGKTDDGEQASVAYFKIKTAQEKYELQQLGDDLEAKINKTEKEIQAMENTLRLLSSSNDYFRKNLESVDPDDPQVAEYNQLELTYYNHMECFKIKKAELETLEKSIAHRTSIIEDLQIEIDRLDNLWEKKEKEVVALNKDINSKKEKLDRASKVIKKVLREIKLSKDPPTFKRLAQKEINVKIQGEKNKNVLLQLSEFCSIYMETGPVVNQYLLERGLTLPVTKPFMKPKDSLQLSSAKSLRKGALHKSVDQKVPVKQSASLTITDFETDLGLELDETGASQCDIDVSQGEGSRQRSS